MTLAESNSNIRRVNQLKPRPSSQLLQGWAVVIPLVAGVRAARLTN